MSLKAGSRLESSYSFPSFKTRTLLLECPSSTGGPGSPARLLRKLDFRDQDVAETVGREQNRVECRCAGEVASHVSVAIEARCEESGQPSGLLAGGQMPQRVRAHGHSYLHAACVRIPIPTEHTPPGLSRGNRRERMGSSPRL